MLNSVEHAFECCGLEGVRGVERGHIRRWISRERVEPRAVFGKIDSLTRVGIEGIGWVRRAVKADELGPHLDLLGLDRQARVCIGGCLRAIKRHRQGARMPAQGREPGRDSF